MVRLWDTEPAMPIFASFLSRSRRVEPGILPKRDSSSTVARGRGAQQEQRVLQCLGHGVGRQDGFGSRPAGDHTFGSRDGPCRRFQHLNAVAHGVQNGAGQGAARVAPFEEPPEGVAGNAEGLRRLPDAPPQHVCPQIFTDGVLKIGVERLRSCPASVSPALQWSIGCSVTQ